MAAIKKTNTVPSPVKKKDKSDPKFSVRKYLQRIHGADVIAIYGISETGGLEILAETDFSKKKVKHILDHGSTYAQTIKYQEVN